LQYAVLSLLNYTSTSDSLVSNRKPHQSQQQMGNESPSVQFGKNSDFVDILHNQSDGRFEDTNMSFMHHATDLRLSNGGIEDAPLTMFAGNKRNHDALNEEQEVSEDDIPATALGRQNQYQYQATSWSFSFGDSSAHLGTNQSNSLAVTPFQHNIASHYPVQLQHRSKSMLVASDTAPNTNSAPQSLPNQPSIPYNLTVDPQMQPYLLNNSSCTPSQCLERGISQIDRSLRHSLSMISLPNGWNIQQPSKADFTLCVPL
jgi:hypothetical protein